MLILAAAIVRQGSILRCGEQARQVGDKDDDGDREIHGSCGESGDNCS